MTYDYVEKNRVLGERDYFAGESFLFKAQRHGIIGMMNFFDLIGPTMLERQNFKWKFMVASFFGINNLHN